MVEFMRAGGMPIWIVLLFGGATLVMAVLFARQPDEGRMAVIRTLTVATVFNIIGGVASCVGMVLWRVPNTPELSADAATSVMIGLAESSTPAILGFSVLSLAWLITGIGMRRLAAKLRTA